MTLSMAYEKLASRQSIVSAFLKRVCEVQNSKNEDDLLNLIDHFSDDYELVKNNEHSKQNLVFNQDSKNVSFFFNIQKVFLIFVNEAKNKPKNSIKLQKHFKNLIIFF